MKKQYKTFILFLLIFSSTILPAYCITTFKETVTKFLFAMGGIAVSSIIIFVGLSLYNRFFINNDDDIDIKFDDIEHTEEVGADGVDDAIISFVKQNRLR